MTVETLKSDLRKVHVALGIVESQILKRSSPEAKSILEGYEHDRARVRESYMNIDVTDAGLALGALIRMQAKEEYLTELIDAYSEPVIQKKSLASQKEKLLSLIEEKKNAPTGR